MSKLYHSHENGCKHNCAHRERGYTEIQEIFANLPEITSRHTSYLQANGVKLCPDDPGAALRLGHVIFNGQGHFDFETYSASRALGVEAFILSGDSSWDISDDLIAFDPVSHRIASWTGRVTVLCDFDQFRRANLLVIRSSLLSWLRHRRTGLVVVNVDQAVKMFHEEMMVGGKRAILFEDKRQARLIQRKLKRISGRSELLSPLGGAL